ncbi:ANK1 [Symbiodinium natans]|uniref:ANK1 protein n=1 Tax=Symbiodinium natans TaxID=878477 RepID=A0A812KFR3_9DINO|nr:ANK1 [Symbiodinium natans]
MIRVWRTSGEELASVPVEQKDAPDALGRTIRDLKKQLHALCGVPRFRQRLVQDGIVLNDDSLLSTPGDVQLVLLPYTSIDSEGLIQAVRQGNLKQVEEMLQRPQDPNLDRRVHGVHDLTPLQVASGNGSLGLVRLLLEAEASVDQRGLQGATSLQVAFENGHLKVVHLLLEAQAHGDVSCQKRCLGRTLLQIAAEKGLVAAARWQIQAGSKLNTTTERGCTPLYEASWGGHRDVVHLLLQARADVAIPDKDGCSPLYEAAWRSHADIVRLLLEFRADPCQADFYRSSPVLIASSRGFVEVARVLLEARARVNDADSGGITPLQMASARGFACVVRLLLESKADVEQTNMDRRTAYDMASSMEIRRLLWQAKE